MSLCSLNLFAVYSHDTRLIKLIIAIKSTNPYLEYFFQMYKLNIIVTIAMKRYWHCGVPFAAVCHVVYDCIVERICDGSCSILEIGNCDRLHALV